jgi:hypothetical protein
MRTLILTATLLAALSGAAQADDAPACATFKWSLAREQALFTAPQPVTSGAGLAVGAGYRVALVDVGALAFPAKPERPTKPGTHGALLALRIGAAGAYDVTLSEEGWIDLADHAERVVAADFSGAKGCPGLRKSVRFELKPGDYTVQLSNAEGDALNIAITPAP